MLEMNIFVHCLDNLPLDNLGNERCRAMERAVQKLLINVPSDLFQLLKYWKYKDSHRDLLISSI